MSEYGAISPKFGRARLIRPILALSRRLGFGLVWGVPLGRVRARIGRNLHDSGLWLASVGVVLSRGLANFDVVLRRGRPSSAHTSDVERARHRSGSVVADSGAFAMRGAPRLGCEACWACSATLRCRRGGSASHVALVLGRGSWGWLWGRTRLRRSVLLFRRCGWEDERLGNGMRRPFVPGRRGSHTSREACLGPEKLLRRRAQAWSRWCQRYEDPWIQASGVV